jgi:membrane associated rhomboid family serine protease
MDSQKWCSATGDAGKIGLMSGPSTPQSQAAAPTCYRHPGRQTYLRCNRCERYICPDCMRAAAVGHQCVECVEAGARSIRTPRTQFGGRERPGTPVVTYALIAINVLAFIPETASVELRKQLALWPPGVAEGELYRLVTSAFMHYGAPHLVLNMWALYVVGPPLEMWLGRLRFGTLYALSGLGGSVLVYLLAPLNTATAGASGAVFGLFGATFVVARRLNLDLRWVAAVIVINLVFTFVVPAVSSHLISWQAHVGGLVTGGLVAAAYVYAPREHRNLIQAAVSVIVLGVFAALVWWRTGVLVAELSL